MTDAEALEAIVKEMDGRAWTPETLNRIAEILTERGYEIQEPDEGTDEIRRD